MCSSQWCGCGCGYLPVYRGPPLKCTPLCSRCLYGAPLKEGESLCGAAWYKGSPTVQGSLYGAAWYKGSPTVQGLLCGGPLHGERALYSALLYRRGAVWYYGCMDGFPLPEGAGVAVWSLFIQGRGQGPVQRGSLYGTHCMGQTLCQQINKVKTWPPLFLHCLFLWSGMTLYALQVVIHSENTVLIIMFSSKNNGFSMHIQQLIVKDKHKTTP